MDIPYYDELVKCRRFLESYYSDFPHNKCEDATRFLFHVLGLEEVSGRYVADDQKKCHSWCYDPKLDIYVDITLDQFNSSYDAISILPSNTSLFVKDKDELAIHLIRMEEFEEKELPLLLKKYAVFS